MSSKRLRIIKKGRKKTKEGGDRDFRGPSTIKKDFHLIASIVISIVNTQTQIN